MSASHDASQRFLFEQTDVRGEIVCLKEAYREALGEHEYSAAVARLLGEFLAATVLLSTTIKFDGRLVLQARGDGPLGLIMAECTSEGNVRGIVRSKQFPESGSLREMLGDGTLAMTIEPRKGEPYQGIVSLTGDDLGDCLAEYFTQSEQLNTVFHFAVDDEQATALMLQQLPAQEEKDPEQRDEQWQRLSILADTLKGAELLDLDNGALLHRLYHQENLQLFSPRPVQYHCSCSRERTANALLTIGKEEVENILAEQGEVEMTCEFCGTRYQFGGDEIRLLLLDSDSATAH